MSGVINLLDPGAVPGASTKNRPGQIGFRPAFDGGETGSTRV